MGNCEQMELVKFSMTLLARLFCFHLKKKISKEVLWSGRRNILYSESDWEKIPFVL